MSTIRSTTQWVGEHVRGGVAVLAATCTLLIVSATSAFAAPSDWTTANCGASGVGDVKTILQGLTQTAWGWGVVILAAVAGLAILAIPLAAVFSGKALPVIMKALFWIAVVLFFGTAILTVLISKATCA